MPVERNTPQLVKKGKGKKRPGYRGKGEYQGGRGYGGSKSSKGGDKGTGGSKGNLGGGGGGQESNYRRYSPPTKKTYTAKTIDSKPVTSKNFRDSKNDFVNTLNRNNQIAAERAGTRFTPYQGGARNTSYYKPNPLSGLLKLAAGFAFPGSGFLLSKGGKFKEGLMNLNDSIQNSDFGRSKNLMDYLDMKKFGGFDEREMARRINMDESKNLQARIDAGEFGGFGIQTPKAKPTFSDPFRNTVGTTTKVNAPSNDAVSSIVPQDLNQIGKGAGYVGYDKNELAAIAAGTKIPQLGDLTSFIKPLATITARERELKNYFDSPIQPKKGIMNIDVGYPSNDLMADALTTPTEGAYGFNLMELDRLKKAGYDPEELSTYPNQDDVQSIIRNLEPSGYTDADFTNKYGYPMTAGLLDNIGVKPAIKTKDTGLGFSVPTGDVGFNASGRLGNLSATVDAIDALKGESVNPQINYSGDFGNTTAYGNFSDDVRNLGLSFTNDKGLSGGISYDAITGEPKANIGFSRTFADGGLASMFTRRG